MFEYQKDNTFFRFNFSSFHPEQIHFCDPEFWHQKKLVQGFACGRGKTWFLDTKDLFGMNTALRHYYRGGLWGKINRDVFLFKGLAQTRSMAEFQLLQRLKQAGMPVPTPIAAKVERIAGGFYRADILVEKVENAQDLTSVLQQQTLTDAQWQHIGQLIAQLHQLQIFHSDLNAHNILLQQTELGDKFWLIDFDKCGEKAGESWKTENLARLNRSFCKEVVRLGIHFNQDNWKQLLHGYQRATSL